MKIITLYDGTLQAKTALRYGLSKLGEKDELVVLQVFQSSLFVDYGAGPGAEETARSEAKQHTRDAVNIIREAGEALQVRIVTEEGNLEEELLRVAAEEHADRILAPARYRGLVKSASCPVHIIPGTILLPVDDSDRIMANLDYIVKEARSADSKIALIGVVPIHLYGSEENEELARVERKTDEEVKTIMKALAALGIEATGTIRSGYPDEEILKAAGEYAVSLIMLPSGGKTPSELAKAATILLDEPNKVRFPILFLPVGV